mmetsp:Transcript_6597/g.22209  ORF Transcript_6597/g.22209 Transcript_6597/m.22209 type:complete len:297 (-) Transcript_6597:137-1027(-)
MSQTSTVITARLTLGTDTALTVPNTGRLISCDIDLKLDSIAAKNSAVRPCTAAKQKTPLMTMNTQCCMVKKMTKSTTDAKTTKYAALDSVISSPSSPLPCAAAARPPWGLDSVSSLWECDIWSYNDHTAPKMMVKEAIARSAVDAVRSTVPFIFSSEMETVALPAAMSCSICAPSFSSTCMTGMVTLASPAHDMGLNSSSSLTTITAAAPASWALRAFSMYAHSPRHNNTAFPATSAMDVHAFLSDATTRGIGSALPLGPASTVDPKNASNPRYVTLFSLATLVSTMETPTGIDRV